jgi:hypothetical protein
MFVSQVVAAAARALSRANIAACFHLFTVDGKTPNLCDSRAGGYARRKHGETP